MKILRKIKRIIVTIIVSIIGVSTKVFGVGPDPLYGPPELQAQAQETEQKLRILETLQGMAKYLIIPIVLIIGLVMYFNKKTSSKVKKVGLALVIISIAVAVDIVILMLWRGYI